MGLGAANGSGKNIGDFAYSPSSTTYSMIFGNLAYLSEHHCPHKQNRDKMPASEHGCGNAMSLWIPKSW